MFKPFEIASMTRDEVLFLTKPIGGYNNTTIDACELNRNMTLCQLRSTKFEKATHTSCGLFDRLPIELVQHVLESMTISSVMNLRATNSTLKEVVEHWTPFVVSMRDARSALAAVIATESAKLWSFPDLASLIYTSSCQICGQHGELLHLLKMKRVCFKCVTTDRRLLALYDQYLAEEMGLSAKDLRTLPQISVKPHRHFWRIQTGKEKIYDYSAALELAMVKHKTCKPAIKHREIRSMYRVSLQTNGTAVKPEMTSRARSAIRKPIYQRRKSNHTSALARIADLPAFLIQPPESTYAQHACCFTFPALVKPATEAARAVKIDALLCAGCSFFFNYHSHLPHQTHTLYEYNEHDPTAKSPLTDHLQSCFFARIFWENLYHPRHDPRNPTNPYLVANGGPYTAQTLDNAVLVHRITSFDPNHRLFRHYKRHTFVDEATGRGVRPMSYNNANFEAIPQRFTTVAHNLRMTPKKTGLEWEIEQKLQEDDAVTNPWIKAVQDTNHDHDLDHQTQHQLERIQRQEAWRALQSQRGEYDPNTEMHEDTYGDVFLGGLDSVSQASWATMRPSSANCLTRGWIALMADRAERQAQTEARRNGTRPRRIGVDGGEGWGFDRLGCVSGQS